MVLMLLTRSNSGRETSSTHISSHVSKNLLVLSTPLADTGVHSKKEVRRSPACVYNSVPDHLSYA